VTGLFFGWTVTILLEEILEAKGRVRGQGLQIQSTETIYLGPHPEVTTSREISKLDQDRGVPENCGATFIALYDDGFGSVSCPSLCFDETKDGRGAPDF